MVAVFEAGVQHAEMSLGLERITVDRVGYRLGCEIPEMDGLPRERAEAGRHEHQPRQKLASQRRRILRQEAAALLREVEQDGIAVENRDVAVDDRRNLGVRIDGEKARVELLALPRIDRDGFERQPGLFEEESDLHRVGR